MIKTTGICLLALSLSSCSFFDNKDNEHYAMCQQLKGKIVMNGATRFPNKANMQNASLGLLEHSYRKEGCE